MAFQFKTPALLATAAVTLLVLGFQNCSPPDATIVTAAKNGSNGSSATPATPVDTNPPFVPAVLPTPVPTPVPSPTPVPTRDGSTAKPFNGSATTVARNCNLAALKLDTSAAGVVEYTYCLTLDNPSDVGGKAYWTRRLSTYTAVSRYNTLRSFANVYPLDNKLVTGLYEMFNNGNDAAGINFWNDAIQRGNITTRQSLFEHIFECSNCAPNMAQLNLGTDDAFVKKLYASVAKSSVAAEGYGVWMAVLAGGNVKPIQLPPDFIRSRIALEPNGLAKTTSTQFLVFVYARLLGREPDQAGYLYYRSLLDGGVSRNDVVTSIVNSAEFKTMHPALAQ